MAGTIDLAQIAAAIGAGSIRELAKLDVQNLLDERRRIAEQDVRRVAMFAAAALGRAAALGVAVGFVLTYEGQVPEVSVNDDVSDEARDFLRETVAVVEAFARQARKPLSGGADPFRDERELLRVWAKRNHVDARFQEEVGVSEETSTEYPDSWASEHLR